MNRHRSAVPKTADARRPARRERPPGRGGNRLRRLLRLAGMTLLALGCYLGWDAWQFLQTPAETPGRDIVVDIEPGLTLGRISALLQERGVITDSLRFRILARAQQKEQKLQAGRFLVNTGWLPQTVLDQLVDGRTMLYRVTVPEGKTWWETARILADAGICTEEDFRKVIHDPEFLRHYGIPFPSAEGFLYPDTYLLPQPRALDERAARATAGRMVDVFWQRAGAALWGEKPPDRKTLRETVILASIVEKETGVPEERARVAGVYANRLQKGMPLQADPTVIYGLGPDFKGRLLRSYLENADNPYNTYRHAGLPPGPICSPGTAALRAALEPEKHDYYYFVATGRDRSHVFSSSLARHNQAVRDYRRAVREGARGAD
jgi:UPF0755 protein